MTRRELLKSTLLLPAAPTGPTQHSDQVALMAMLDRAGIPFDTPDSTKVVLKVDGDIVTGVEHETAEFRFTKRGGLDRVILWSTDFDGSAQ